MRALRVFLWIAWGFLVVVGLAGLYVRITSGREPVNYGSYVPWGLWVSAYIYFIGLSAGAFLLSSLIYVAGVERLRAIGRTALFAAALTLFMALFSIWMDLGHMERFWEVFTRPNFHSMMAWMVWLYTAYFLLILAELWFELRCDLAALAERGGPGARIYHLALLGWQCPKDAEGRAACEHAGRRTLRVLGTIGVPLAIAFHGGVGALFATLAARPYWHQSLYPILFLTGALVSGGALLLAVVGLTAREHDPRTRDLLALLGRIVVALLLFDVLIEWAELSIPLWYGVGPEVDLIREVLFGRYWYVSWVFHVLLGTVFPLVLLLRRPGEPFAAALGGGLIALTFLAVRLNLVIPGQVTPALRGLENAYQDHRLRFEYVPSLYEWAVTASVVAIGMALFYLGRKYLPLEEPVCAEPSPASRTPDVSTEPQGEPSHA